MRGDVRKRVASEERRQEWTGEDRREERIEDWREEDRGVERGVERR